MAMAGNVEGLLELADGDAKGHRDGVAYKWLCAASDFGHDAADELIDDLLETSSLRYDDDQLVTGNAHWELAVAYLTASEGLPRDLDKARVQLAAAEERGFPDSVEDGAKMLTDTRARVTPEARKLIDEIYGHK